MGLDMYLTRKMNIQRGDSERLVVDGVTVMESRKLDFEEQTIGTWRKANAIHRWFVEHVQDDVDNCATYYVSENDLKDLLAVVKTVLEKSELVAGTVINGYTFKDGKKTPILEAGMVIKDPTTAHELLPTQEGFFFGSTAYDQYYYDDLKLTERILEEALEQGGDYYYSSSW